MEEILLLVRERLTGGARAFIFDAVQVSGFDADIRSKAFDVLSALRRARVLGAAAAVTSPGLRMLGAAVAFGTGLPIEFFPTFEDAEKRITKVTSASP